MDRLGQFCDRNFPCLIFHSYGIRDSEDVNTVQYRRIKKVSTANLPLDWSDMYNFMSHPNCVFNSKYADTYEWIIFYNLRIYDSEKINFILKKYPNKKILFHPNLASNQSIGMWDSYIDSRTMDIMDLSKINDKIMNVQIEFKKLLIR